MTRVARFEVEFTKSGDGAIRAAINSLGDAVEESSRRASTAGKNWEEVGRKIGTSMRWAGGLAAAGLAVLIKNTADADRISKQLDARLSSLGATAAVSRQQIEAWGQDLVRATTFDDDSINEAATALLRFTNIRADEFQRSLSVALDLAEDKSISAADAAAQLGRALNDPIKGLRQLADEGVALSGTQVQLVKDLVAAGREAEAQQILLDELETRYGDAAEAARDTFGGALKALGRDIAELVEGDSGSLDGMTDGVNALIETINDPAVQQGFDTLVSGALSVANEFAAAIPTIVEFSSEVYTAMSRVSEYLAGRHDELMGVITGDRGRQLAGIRRTRDAVEGYEEPSPLFAGVRGRSDTVPDRARAKPPPSSKKKKSGRSDADRKAREAERAAERIAKAIRQMSDAQRDWQNILDDQGNPIAKEYADRLADITDQAEKFSQAGVPTGKVDEFTSEMKALAEAIQAKELAEFQKEFTNETLAMAAAASGPGVAAFEAYRVAVEELDKQLQNGLITQQLYEERLNAMRTPAEEMLDALRQESEVIGLSSDQQEIWNNLKLAGVDAESEWGQQIIAATAELQRQREAMSDQIETMDGIREAGKGFVSDLAHGVELTDALNDAWDRLYDKLVEMGSEDLMDMIFGKQGEPAGGSTGGWLGSLFNAFGGGSSAPAAGSSGEQAAFDSWFNAANGSGGGSSGGGFWAGLLSSVFGGGRADGGTGMPNRLYRVNERGFEMASVGGKDYMMVGPQPVQITPHEALGGGGGGNTFNFQFEAPTSTRTQAQLAGRVEYGLSRNQRNR